eukprot:scaffold40881_cov16-Tisochrysis_lutea.AAC.1
MQTHLLGARPYCYDIFAFEHAQKALKVKSAVPFMLLHAKTWSKGSDVTACQYFLSLIQGSIGCDATDT